MQELQDNEFGEDQLVVLYYHVSDDYATAETEARASYFGVSGIPETDFDATDEVVGAGSTVINTFRPIINNRLAQPTPIEMSTIGLVRPAGARADTSWVRATFRVVDTVPGDYGTLRAQFVVYEYLSGIYPWTVRDVLPPETITTLNAPGDSVVVTRKFVVDPSWNAANLDVAVFLEDTSPKLVVNAQIMPDPYNNRFAGTDANASEIDHFGEATYRTVLTNTGVMTDTITVSVAHDEFPDGMGSYDWITFFCDSSGTCYFTPWEYVLEPGQAETFDVHVIDNVGNVQGMALTTITAASNSDPLAVSTESFATFVDLPSILLVDDDGGAGFEADLRTALENNGYAARVWDADAKGRPGPTEISSYWAVFWTTANASGTSIGMDDENDLMSYLDGGGNLMLASMNYLSSRVDTSTFITDYLHIDSWANDNGGFIMTGVSGNAVSDGMSLTIIGGPFPVNASDAVTVSAPAEVVFTSPPGNKGIAVEEDGHKALFLAFPFECVKTADADPNNQDALVERVLSWFSLPSGVEDGEIHRLSLGQNYPNPFNPVTNVAFTVPNGAERVTLTVHNVAGRVVRTLVDGELPAGPGTAVWDGTDDSGNRLSSGIYFAKLSAGGRSAFRKMTLLK